VPAPLHVYYRSYGGDNDKPRPGYYSKALALASLLRAAEAVDPLPRITFLNDGAIAPELLTLMRRHGRVIQVDGGSNRASYRLMITRAARENSVDGVLWFAEDDYLYRADALSAVTRAAEEFAHADYFTLYCPFALDPAAPRREPAVLEARGTDGLPDAPELDGVRWFNGASTTSTFGVRSRVLREDASLLRLTPYAGAAWDETTCRTYMGQRPFTTDELREDLLAVPPVPRKLVRGLARTAISARSHRCPEHRRVLLGSDPELVSHMEIDVLDPDFLSSTTSEAIDWEAEAAAVRDWAAANGVGIS
jgi:hypothetical protein